MPYKNGNIVFNATYWTDEMISSLKENHATKTNIELARMLGLTLTVTRNKLYELGLRKFTSEYWTPEMVQYLRDHYQTCGDVEIMEYFKMHYPKRKDGKEVQFIKRENRWICFVLKSR